MALSSLRSAARPLKPFLKPAIDWVGERKLPEAARSARSRDLRGVERPDPGPEAAITAALDWLGAAQDGARGGKGGVARDYSHVSGWAAEYPETTGYIVPTILDQAARRGDAALMARGKGMLDWLFSIQFAEGGFQGGTIGQEPCVPVTFNTGQILMGLAAGARKYGDPYLTAMQKAATWLADTQDPDGCWRAYRTPFASQDDKAYETHVAWGLLEAARVEDEPLWSYVALRQVDWALTCQQANGWMAQCCLSDPAKPLTHTLGYALRGIMEAYRWSGQEKYLAAAARLGAGLRLGLGEDGYLCGRFDSEWRDAADWVCLTGTAQVAHCWLMLAQDTGDGAWREAAERALGYLRRRIDTDGPVETRGAVAGSFPIHGDYVSYGYPNWAAKFFIDAQQLALDIGSGK